MFTNSRCSDRCWDSNSSSGMSGAWNIVKLKAVVPRNRRLGTQMNDRTKSRLAWHLACALIAVVLWRLVGMLAVFFVLLVWVLKVGLWMWPDE